MGKITDKERIQKGLIEQAYYDPEFDKDDWRNALKERGRIRRERYLHRMENIKNMPDSTPLQQCAKLRKYYGFAWNYKLHLRDFLIENWNQEYIQNFMNAGILLKQIDTVWLDKEKLQEFEEFLVKEKY